MAESREQVERISDIDIAKMAVKVARSAFPVFAEREWTWGRGDDALIPSEDRIAETVQRLLLHARDGKLGETATGRFTVTRYEGEGRETLSVLLELGELEGATDA